MSFVKQTCNEYADEEFCAEKRAVINNDAFLEALRPADTAPSDYPLEHLLSDFSRHLREVTVKAGQGTGRVGQCRVYRPGFGVAGICHLSKRRGLQNNSSGNRGMEHEFASPHCFLHLSQSLSPCHSASRPSGHCMRREAVTGEQRAESAQVQQG